MSKKSDIYQGDLYLKEQGSYQKLQVGHNYLHNHKQLEFDRQIPTDHVIVDRKDWEEVVRLFEVNPEIYQLLGK